MTRAKLNHLLLKCDTNRIFTSEPIPVVEEGCDLRSRRSAKSDGGLVVDTSYAAAKNKCQQLDEIDVELPISSPASSISGILVNTDDTRSESSTTSGVLITPPEPDDACTDWSGLGGVPLTPSLTDDVPGEWTLIDHPRTHITDNNPVALSASDTPASLTFTDPYRLRVMALVNAEHDTMN
ncbi:hypothetical protein LTR28_005110 [Elasticomyces elasticus]|nr:hypothetical protein LTR28_005110 [Elasticomyces elasticus]